MDPDAAGRPEVGASDMGGGGGREGPGCWPGRGTAEMMRVNSLGPDSRGRFGVGPGAPAGPPW